MKEKNNKILKCILLLLCAMLCAGVATVFSACEVHVEEGIMACHWAQMSVLALALAMTLQSAFACFFKRTEVGVGIYFALIVQSALAMAVPGGFIRLCMMQQMRCNHLMRPYVAVCSALIMIVSALLFVSGQRKRMASDEETV